MLTVEQVKNLDGKVRKALDLIESLKKENNMLRTKLDEYKQRVDQLESVVDGFKLEQLEIEEGIKDVLTQLDQLEDQITDPSPSSPIKIENSAPQTEQSVFNHDDNTEEQPVEPQFAESRQTAAEEHGENSVQAPELEIF